MPCTKQSTPAFAIRAIALLAHTGQPVRCRNEYASKIAIVSLPSGTFTVNQDGNQCNEKLETEPADADADAGAWIYVDYIVGDGAFDVAGLHPGGGSHAVYGRDVHGHFGGLRDGPGGA